ncbi:MAG: Na+/H+ antiporter subunit E [Spirochaetota bacterium]
MRGRVVLALLLLAVWFALAYPLDLQELGAAGIVTLLVLLLPLGAAEVLGEFRIAPRSVLFAIAYVFVFLGELIRANVDVAFRVLSPQLPIRPGIVRVRTKLTSRLGRLMLANSITLTPGTITVETEGENLYVHWINVEGDDIEVTTQRIVEKFERYLEVICG